MLIQLMAPYSIQIILILICSLMNETTEIV